MIDRNTIASHFVPTFNKKDGIWLPEKMIVILSSIIQYGQGRYPENYYITKDMIAMDVYNTGSPSRRQKENIDIGIEELYEYDSNFIRPVNGNRTRWEVNGKYVLRIQDKYDYARVYSYEMNIIANYQPNNMMSFKAFYLKFLSLFYDNPKEECRGCGYSIKKLSEVFDVEKSTIEDRLDKLKELGLINVIPSVRYKTKDDYSSISNTYYRPPEKEWAEKFLKYRLNSPYFDSKRQNKNLQSSKD